MKNLILFCFFIFFFSCLSQKTKSNNTISNNSLCGISQNEVNVTITELPNKKEPKIIKEEIEGQTTYTKQYNHRKEGISFSVMYSEGNVVVYYNNQSFKFKKGGYHRLYERDFSDGLSWMFFTNYLVQSDNRKYLVLQTFNNYNASAAFNNIYFVIELSDLSKYESYSFGSFGYCNNIFGDYNRDGVLDIIVIDFVSSNTDRFDTVDPKGIFNAKVFSLNESEIYPLENDKGELKCRYSYNGKDIYIEEGNWF